MRSTARLILPFIPVLALAFAPPAGAQYFGRNAVQWEQPEVRGPQDRALRRLLLPRGEGWRRSRSGAWPSAGTPASARILRHQMKDRQPVILYASNAHFQQTNTIGGAPGEGTGGVTEAFKRRIVLPVGASLAETDHVLGHELVHAFQYAMTGQGKISDSELPGRAAHAALVHRGHGRVPLRRPGGPAHRDVDARRGPAREGLPTIRQLDNSAKYFPYRYGQALWAYIAGALRRRRRSRACCAASGPHTNDAEDDPASASCTWTRADAVQGMARRHPRRLRDGRRSRQARTPTPTAPPW